MKTCTSFLLLICLFQILEAKVDAPRLYEATRVENHPPSIDGKLDDEIWQRAPVGSEFTQHEPNEGERPTEPTVFQIAYDSNNLYVAIKAYDTQPDRVDSRVTRRDEAINTDRIGILLDSYYDRRTAFEFGVSAGGVKIDALHSGDGQNEDTNFDPVWYVETGREPGCWTAEMKIPFNQLRYSGKNRQVWGLQVYRYLHRNQEISLWQHIPKTAPGFVSHFGELRGLAGVSMSRRIELLPYTVAGTERFKPEAGNPFAGGQDNTMRLGLDGKIGVTSDLTVDFTINPDFGQVEADPSEVNLTAFETFFEEKRPFFVEGSNIFNYRLMIGNGPFSNDMLFYSRRIGRVPQYSPDLLDDEYADVPRNSSILGAFKLSGKTATGWSVGVMNAVTEAEKANIDLHGSRREQTVEPLANYFVGRLQKDYNDGTTSIGGMVTATNRSLTDKRLEFLHSSAYSAGIDLIHQWHNKDYQLHLSTAFSHVRGTPEALLETQTGPTHYFQRPDASHLALDSTATSLSGHGGYIDVGKFGGRWQYAFIGMWRSPGLELNDIGFMRQADFMLDVLWLGYRIPKAWWIFRSLFFNIERFAGHNFNMDKLFSGGGAGFNVQFRNYWRLGFNVSLETDNLDVTRLRGGPALEVPGGQSIFMRIDSDERKAVSAGIGGFVYRGADDISTLKGLFPSLNIRPSDRLMITIMPELNLRDVNLQYISTESYNNQPRYILGRINQKTLATVLRFNYSVTPNFSLQYYGQPFLSSGQYSDFKRITHPRADSYSDRYHSFSDKELEFGQDTIYIDENGDGSTDYSFDKPDFNFRQFRSNLVLRWEYSPGSTLFFVWSQGRTGFASRGEFAYRNDMQELFRVYPENVFLVKLNHWFAL